MHVLVLQHLDSGHPWYLRRLLEEVGATATTLRPDGAPADYPDPSACDAVWVMGGAMQVWQEDEHPWLVPEKQFIREVVAAGVPYLGVCLGHQLLADALDGSVREAPQPEIGLFRVEPTAAGMTSPFFAGCEPGPRLQWHKAEVGAPPSGAEVLARSDRCAIQAMTLGPATLSIQYHVEVDTETLPTWCQSDEALAMLDETFGETGGGGLTRFQNSTLDALPALQQHAQALFKNWYAAAARTRR